MLTKALGSVAGLEARAHDVPFDVGDLLLLCSDGLYGPLGDDGIARVFGALAADLEATASALVDAANAAGGPDNVTVVLVRPGV
jgi:protein phosphatase